MATILNIAAGKIEPINLELSEPNFLVNVDTMYYRSESPATIEYEHERWGGLGSKKFNLNENIFSFMERTSLFFDRVCVYRFLEHVSMDKILYFIYLLSTITKKGAEIDVIVPNYDILALMIIEEQANIKRQAFDFESHNIELTTELLNEPSCPHASIWTPWRAHHFFQLEKRFIVNKCDPKFTFDGRDIYLRFIAERL